MDKWTQIISLGAMLVGYLYRELAKSKSDKARDAAHKAAATLDQVERFASLAFKAAVLLDAGVEKYLGRDVVKTAWFAAFSGYVRAAGLELDQVGGTRAELVFDGLYRAWLDDQVHDDLVQIATKADEITATLAKVNGPDPRDWPLTHELEAKYAREARGE